MIFTLLMFASIGAHASIQDSLVTEFSWKFIDYQWKSDEPKAKSVYNGNYTYMRNVPIDVDRAADGRTFLVLAGGLGVPATLCTVGSEKGDSGPLLMPYPNWTWYQDANCEGIVSASGISIDECNRLWVLDSGKVDGQFVCDPKLLAFDLTSNELLVSQPILPNSANDKSGKGFLFYPIVLTDGDNCENTTVFVSDAEGNALVVWNGHDVFHVKNELFKPESNGTEFNIDGEKFDLDLGVLNLALTPAMKYSDERILFFRPLASRSLYAVDSEEFVNTTSADEIGYYGRSDVFNSQVSSMIFSSAGILFYGAIEEIGIGCWRMDLPLDRENFVTPLIDRKRLQYVAGLKVKKNSETGQEELLILSNRLQKVYRQTLDFDETNFYVLRIPIDSIIKNTVCEPDANFSAYN